MLMEKDSYKTVLKTFEFVIYIKICWSGPGCTAAAQSVRGLNPD